MKKRLGIAGMSCGHCVQHVRKALEGVRGVTKVEVDLAGKYADVEGEGLDDAAMKAAVADAGYEVTGVS